MPFAFCVRNFIDVVMMLAKKQWCLITVLKYEGRLIYNVSFGVVYLIFQNKKFQDIRFVENLIYNVFVKFRYKSDM